MKKILILILAFLLIYSPAWATTYYMNSSTGSNSYNGLSATYTSGTTGPWAYPSAFTGTNFLQPGDTVHIASGTTYTGSNCYFTVNSNGAPGNPINIIGDGTTPIFNCASPVTGISGWTGWTNTSATYTFTVTSANATAAATYTDSTNSQTFTVTTTISGSTTLVTTGTAVPGAFGTLTLVTGTGDPTITYSSYVDSNVKAVSNIVVPWTVEGVIVDGSYNLVPSFNGLAYLINYRWYQQGGYVYINLPDGSDPSGHTFELTGLSNSNQGIGTITSNGNFINFTNIETYGSTTFGWLLRNLDIAVNNSSSYFSGREGLYCNTYYQPVGCYFSTFNNFTSEYSNGKTLAGGLGQNVTFEGSYNTFKNGTIAYGGMAGFDALNYNPSTNAKMYQTPASYNLVLNTQIFQNSRESLVSGGGGGDPQVYCDGCNNLQIINTVITGNENNQFNLAKSGVFNSMGIWLSTEHPTIAFPHDVYLDNDVVQGNSYHAVLSGVLSGSTTPWYNVWVMNSDFFGDYYDGGYLNEFVNFNTSMGVTFHFYNNILYQNSGGTVVMNFPPTSVVDSNNNLYYTGAGSGSNYINNSYPLSGWQSASGQDSNSTFGNPYIFSSGSNGYALERTALGQANTSPAVGLADPGYQNTYFNISSNGTTRSDSAIDTAGTDAGYHYGMTYVNSINWPVGSQVGTDIN